MNLSDIPQCPVIYPTLQQFNNFRQLTQDIDKKYKQSVGMVKQFNLLPFWKVRSCFILILSIKNQIVPPKGWVSKASDYQKRLQGLVVNHPIEQNTFGKGGIYQCLHIPKKSINFSEFKQKFKQLDKITDNRSADEIEEMFWKNVTFSAPVYGADLLNSLMDKSSKNWNLNELDSVLMDALSNKVKGINTPYCYVGSWKAFFCWHTEDMDLSGVNFIHEGKSKFWYAINYQDKHILEKEAAKLFPDHFSSCKQHLRHKTSLINPYYLKKKYPELRITKIEHTQNTIIAVLGGSYHTGFNFGFNIAEAVNYGTIDWLRQLIEAKPCECSRSNVKASIYQIYTNLVKNNSINKTNEFKLFQEYIFQKVEEESESQQQEVKKGVSRQFSKKIKKAKRAPKTIVFKDEEYEIDNWAQCQKCKIWRIVKHLPGARERFECNKAGKQCYKKKKIDKKIFTIQK